MTSTQDSPDHPPWNSPTLTKVILFPIVLPIVFASEHSWLAEKILFLFHLFFAGLLTLEYWLTGIQALEACILSAKNIRYIWTPDIN